MSKSNNKTSNRLFWGLILGMLIIILPPLLWGTYRLVTSPTQLVPYPYTVQTISYEEQTEAEKTTVLIVGDRMAKALENYHPLLLEKSSVHLKTPLPIFNWAEEHESLARTLAKLRSLKKIPRIVIYHGASEEFYEKRFQTSDIGTVLKNFERHENVKFMSLIMTMPVLSRFIYSPVHRLALKKDITKDEETYSSEKRQLQAELGYKLFEAELNDLVTWAKENKTQLLFVNTPINLETLPQQVCDNATTENLKVYQEELQERIAKDDLKTVAEELRQLNQKIIGNSLNFHMLGTVYLKTGQIAKAREEFIKAAAYDCSPWRANPIHNILIAKVAKENSVPLINFDQLVNRNLAQDATFISEIYPQHLYYQQFVEELSLRIREILHI